MRNRGSRKVWGFQRAILGGVMLCLALAATLLNAQAQAPARHPKHKKNAPAQTKPQPYFVETPKYQGMPFVHIVPFGIPKKLTTPPLSSAGGLFSYYGGPVISNIHIVEVLWGSFVDVPSTTGLPQFFTDITKSNYFDLLSEYGTVGVPGASGGAGSNQLIGRGTFDGKFTITPSICPGSATNPPPSCTVTDTQIKAELQRQLSHLPVPVKDTQGNYNTTYMFYFPPGVHISAGTLPSCQPGGFCAYHSSLIGGLPSEIPYGVFPDFSPASACSTECGFSTPASNLTTATSHEMGEAVTDANIGNATSTAPPLAWYDTNNNVGEIGDNCAGDQQQVTAGANTYVVQALYSNMQAGCVIAPASLVLTAVSETIPGKAFNLTVSATSPIFGNMGAYSNTIHFTSSDAQAVLPADYTFVPATDNGTHTFSVTLNALNSQTVTATDTLAAPITGSTSVNVTHKPDLTIIKTHTGNFSQGQTGAHYSITVGNTGDIASIGTVTVVDSLPPDLTATAMSGTGWSCTLGTLTCTRADALAANANYPVITLTVNVAANSNPAITNTAMVSGGGEANLLNDQADDLTTVTQFPDLFPSLQNAGTFSQGQTGAQFFLNVQNAGSAPTTGAVTVAVTLGTGLTATGITGPNWTCVLATLRCTRADALAAFAFYDLITITVNVALNAPSTVTSTAVVSGGGEVVTSNDTATDPTPISGPVSDLAITGSHAGSFRQGQVGAVFHVTVNNVGVVATSGLVTVNEIPDFGFTLTALSGTGWSCAPSQEACTRSDALAAAGSYPVITATVDVSATAPATLNNNVSVFGGGEINTLNDGAVDTVTILPVADLIASSSHQGSFGQGQTGATYSLTAINTGGATSVGVITLTDTLPAGLTATAMSGAGWACTLGTLTCTSSAAVSTGSSSTQVTLTVNVDPAAASSVTNTVTVSGGGEANTANDTATDPTQIMPPVSVTVTNSNSTVTAGQAASYSFSVASFAPDAVTLSCTGLPVLATCSFNPASVTGQGASTVLTIATTAPTRSAAHLVIGNGPAAFYILPLPLLGLLMIRRKSARGKGTVRLAASAALLGIAFLVGCGGSNSPPPMLHGGTPAGTYTITVTAADNGAAFQGTTTVPLTVNWNGL